LAGHSRINTPARLTSGGGHGAASGYGVVSGIGSVSGTSGSAGDSTDPGATWPAPRGIILANVDWVADIARRYHLAELVIRPGSVVLERISATGGRCFCYPDGSWLIGLSEPRLQRCGRRGIEGIVAHELLHAWLWSQHRYGGHGPVFGGHAAVRGIPRWCASYREVRQQGPQQLTLFDTWPPPVS
jgi:hypothetical protein